MRRGAGKFSPRYIYVRVRFSREAAGAMNEGFYVRRSVVWGDIGDIAVVTGLCVKRLGGVIEGSRCIFELFYG